MKLPDRIESLCATHETALLRLRREGNDHGNEPRANLMRSLGCRVAALSHLLEAVSFYQQSAAFASRDDILSAELESIRNEVASLFGEENGKAMLAPETHNSPKS